MTATPAHGSAAQRRPANGPDNPSASPVWDVTFAIGIVVVIGVVAFSPGAVSARVIRICAFAAMYLLYIAFGRKLIRRGETGMPTLAFTVGQMCLLGVTIAIAPNAPLGWFFVFPMIFMSSPMRIALGLAATASLLPPAFVLLEQGFGSRDLMPTLVEAIVCGSVACVVGTWIGDIIGESTQRRRLIDELEASRAQVAALSHEAGIAAERTRLAGEIHDTLAQGFTSIVALTRAIESEMDTDPGAARRHVAMVADTARENLAESRAMVEALTPEALDSGTLEAAIRRRAQRLADEANLQADVHVDTPVRLATVVEVVLLRTAQEAMTNVAKHARAQHVRVDLRQMDDAVRLEVADDGCGFDPDGDHDGFGLRGMRARAEQIDATLTVHSGPDGTTMTLEVPR